jgi:phosphoglycerate-specific signal transduction histidine kinase
MIQENHQSGFTGFADAFGDIFNHIVATQDVAAAQQKHESKRERQPIQVETRARLTGERVREIVSDQIEELADFVESLLLDQRGMLERQHAAQLDLLSKIVALVSQMQGATSDFGATAKGGERG